MKIPLTIGQMWHKHSLLGSKNNVFCYLFIWGNNMGNTFKFHNSIGCTLCF